MLRAVPSPAKPPSAATSPRRPPEDKRCIDHLNDSVRAWAGIARLKRPWPAVDKFNQGSHTPAFLEQT